MPIVSHSNYSDMIKIAEADLKERLGERELQVERREHNVERYLDIAKLCIVSLQDHSPHLAEYLQAKLNGLSK